MKSAKHRTLILIRHAHRTRLDGGLADNGLSPKGKKQAKRIQARALKWLKQAKIPQRQLELVTSPKLRCVETLRPLAAKLGQALELRLKLAEGPGFESRAKAFLADWKKGGAQVTWACSHGDVLPALLEHAVGAPLSLDKGAWCALEWDGTRFKVAQLLQEP